MISANNIAKSKKRIGIYEKEIISTLEKHFQNKGYQAIPHSRLNIAWGSILSDIDLMLLKDQSLTYIEVKSSRDNLGRAKQQTDRMMDYFDYAYVATDRRVKNWDVPNVGLLYVQGSVSTLRQAKKFSSKPKFSSVIALKKKCIARFFGDDTGHLMHVDKYELAQHVYATKQDMCTRECLKEIATCGGSCDTFCPVSEMRKRLSLQIPNTF